MNRKITPEETDALFKFVHKHFVYHYDLQIELVDHLAASIEEQWEENADLSFEDGLNYTFKKFGIHGFSKIKEQKEKELNRKYNIMLWKYLLEFYRWPKMISTLAFTMVLFTLLRIVENDLWIIVPYFTILTIGIVYYFYKIFPRDFKVKTKPGKSFMLLNKLKDVQSMAVIAVQIPLQIGNFWNISKIEWINNNQWGLLLMSMFIVSFTIALYGNFFFIPKKIKEHFMEQFGEFAQ